MSYSNESTYFESPAARVAGAVFAAVAEFSSTARRWAAAVRADYVRRATFRQLHELDDRTLYDIGLTRDSIRDVVKGMDVR